MQSVIGNPGTGSTTGSDTHQQSGRLLLFWWNQEFRWSIDSAGALSGRRGIQSGWMRSQKVNKHTSAFGCAEKWRCTVMQLQDLAQIQKDTLNCIFSDDECAELLSVISLKNQDGGIMIDEN
jgi:hypothetical protein